MANPAGSLQPAIDALEEHLADLERKASGLLQSINLLREKAGLPLRPHSWSGKHEGAASPSGSAPFYLHADRFSGKRLGSAVREYLEMRKSGGSDAPATAREIFDALKQGGFVSNAKDDATALVVLRSLLRKNTVMFVKLQNGKYGLCAWYPNLKQPNEAAGDQSEDSGDVNAIETDATVEAVLKGAAA
jgi:hypothetical protein